MAMLQLWTKLVFIFLFGGAYVRSDEHRCLTSINSDTRAKLSFGDELIIQVSNNTLNQMSSRVFGTIIREILNYNVIYETIKFTKDPIHLNERERLYETLDLIRRIPKRPILNLGVWMPADYHLLPPNIDIAGRFSTGRFGWFIPKQLMDTDEVSSIISYRIFKNSTTNEFNRFLFDENILKQFEIKAEYTPPQCEHVKCVILLSGHQADTVFVTNHIDELELYVKVVWFGDSLKYVTENLFQQFRDKESDKKSFIVLHWTPSEVIDVDTMIEYETILMPKCEQFMSEGSKSATCKYELMPILMYHSEQFNTHTYNIESVFNIIDFNQTNEKHLLQMYNNVTDPQMSRHSEVRTDSNFIQTNEIWNNAGDREAIFDEIACKFIKENVKMLEDIEELSKQIANGPKRIVYIGGIYPKMDEEKDEHNGIRTAVKMAEAAIKANASLLPDIDLQVIDNDDGCHLDTVMRTFVSYYIDPHGVLGVLGPPCSETVEPIASLSKHINMAVISYSAEGVSFSDRDKYPYFFRTIGENRQYEYVYVQLLKQLNWHRVVAFTQDGQKYTEYISQLENALKENGIELTNKKFSKYLSSTEMKSSLQDLKNKNSNIIIADIYDQQAGVVLCEAYKLQMFAKHGYVWFLPIWLNSKEIYESSATNCTRQQIDEMLEGHFKLAHQSYAAEESIMETNHTVGEWKVSYNQSNSSHYGGYAYDAVWVYALALDKLLKDSPSSLATLHLPNTTERFIKFISETDLNGVSGRIQFGEGGSRFSNINIMQWINNENRLVGTFEPNVSEANGKRIIQGGKFNFSASNIKWLTPDGSIPDDGTSTCSVGGLAQLLGYDCSQTMLIITAVLCSLLVILVSAASFVFWKRRYDQKLKASAKLMRNFGIDLLSMSPVHTNTLDKWEVSKDRVVINRRLGEGAFGTVYGGEAQIGDQGWTAVAVKTLKKGSNTEDRIDFLSEAEAMKRFDHANVVKLLGVCLQTEPIYAVMEFMLYGDLKTYLLARRHLVNEKICDESDISPKRLTMMALDVARALHYLSEMKYVHRDVACRNCLVNAQRMVKLGDFGMARSTSENDYYRFSRKGMLPVRWMSPESLSLGKFTPASDIWSFGVLLFEIITFGSFPFQGMTNNQVLDHVKEGNTLTIPNGIKPQLEGLMKACWNLSYVKRPTASEVAEFILSYPKLVTASLDVPLASVQIAETESDQLELLPGLRKYSTPGSDDQKSSTLNHSKVPNGITLSEFNGPNDDYTVSNPPTPSITMGYNPIEPLLGMNGNNGSLRRYVPMYGTKKKNRALQMNEHMI